MRRVLIVGMALLAPLSVNWQAQAEDQGQQLLSGTVYAADGSRLGGAKVEASTLLTGPDGSLTQMTFASGTTDSRGGYSLAGAPPKSSGLAEVEVMVTATKGDAAVHQVLLAKPPTSSAGRWARVGTEATSLARLSLRMQIGAVSEMDAGRAATERAPGARPTPRRVGVAGSSACAAWQQTVWVPLSGKGTRVLRYVPLQRLTTRGHSRQTYEWETTRNTEMEVAFTGSGGNYAGGLTKSKTQADRLRVKMTVGNRKSKLLKMQWQFRKYRKKCVGAAYQTTWKNVYQWRPHKLTSGSEVVANRPSWRCRPGNSVDMAVETWVARTSQIRWAGYFSIGGVMLDARQTNSRSHALTAIPDGGEPNPRMCGDNDFPAQANRVREVARG